MNIKLDIERNRVFATEALDKAKALGDKAKYAEGRKVISHTLELIKNSPSANEGFVASLQGDLQTSLSGLRDRNQYMSMGKGYMKQNARCHKKKRAANFNKHYASQSHYQTKSRSAQVAIWSKDDSDDSDDEDNALSVPSRYGSRKPRTNQTAPTLGRKRKKKSKKMKAPRILPPKPTSASAPNSNYTDLNTSFFPQQNAVPNILPQQQLPFLAQQAPPPAVQQGQFPLFSLGPSPVIQQQQAPPQVMQQAPSPPQVMQQAPPLSQEILQQGPPGPPPRPADPSQVTIPDQQSQETPSTN